MCVAKLVILQSSVQRTRPIKVLSAMHVERMAILQGIVWRKEGKIRKLFFSWMGHRAKLFHFSYKIKMDFHDLLKKICSLNTQPALCREDKKEAIHTLPDTSIAMELIWHTVIHYIWWTFYSPKNKKVPGWIHNCQQWTQQSVSVCHPNKNYVAELCILCFGGLWWYCSKGHFS